MKQFLLSLGIFTLLFMTPSCDVIDQPFKGNIQDTTSTQQQRNVLIEDFTGHRCKNCPKASKAIEALVDAYGSRIIGLAIHAGRMCQGGRRWPYAVLNNQQQVQIFGYPSNMKPPRIAETAAVMDL